MRRLLCTPRVSNSSFPCHSHQSINSILSIPHSLSLYSTHTIIEAHPVVYQKMLADGWDKKPNVRIFHARWQDVLAEMGDFDAIFFDTFDDVRTMGEVMFCVSCCVVQWSILYCRGAMEMLSCFCIGHHEHEAGRCKAQKKTEEKRAKRKAVSWGERYGQRLSRLPTARLGDKMELSGKDGTGVVPLAALLCKHRQSAACSHELSIRSNICTSFTCTCPSCCDRVDSTAFLTAFAPTTSFSRALLARYGGVNRMLGSTVCVQKVTASVIVYILTAFLNALTLFASLPRLAPDCLTTSRPCFHRMPSVAAKRENKERRHERAARETGRRG